MPNVCRRILEAYLGFRAPDGHGWTEKLSLLFPVESESVRVEKFLNEFSHLKNADRFLLFPDLSECATVVALIMKALQTHDVNHFQAMCGNCEDGEEADK